MIRALTIYAVDTIAHIINATLDAAFPSAPDDVMAVAEAAGVTPMPDSALLDAWHDLADDRIAAFIEGGAR